MKKIYTLLFFFLLSLSLYAQKQIEITITGVSIDINTMLYSYYPLSKGNPPVSVEKTTNGKAILNIPESLPKGIYSLYASENGNINNAPWTDIYIDPSNDRTMILTWNMITGNQSFENSEDNKEFSIYKNKYIKLQNSLYQIDQFQKSFEYSSNELTDELSKIKDQLQKSTDSLLDVKHVKEKKIWQRYLPLLDRYTSNPPGLEKFWDDFPINDEGVLHSPATQTVLYQYQSLLREKYHDQQETDSISIATIYKKFADTRIGFSYFRDWLKAWFDNNGTQKQYLQGIKLLSESPAATPEEKKMYTKEWNDTHELQPGNPFPLISFTSQNSQFELNEEKTDQLSLVFFSADCHFCIEELGRLNNHNGKQNIIAINVNSNDKTEDKEFTGKYPNIRFVYPADPAAVKEKLAFRGTPAEYGITKKDNVWIIEDMR